jgi:O-antigen ligase
MSVGTGDAIVYAMSVIVCLFFVGVGVTLFYRTKHIALKTLCLMGSYFVVTMMCYFTWVTATAMTESAFIDLFFKWMFLIMFMGLFPLVIGGIIYAGYVIITIAPFKRMLERGEIADKSLSNRMQREIRKQKYG